MRGEWEGLCIMYRGALLSQANSSLVEQALCVP